MVRPEEAASEGSGMFFDVVDVVTAGVEAAVRHAFGILVGEEIALCELYCQRAVVLAGDHLQVAALVLQFGNDGCGDSRRDCVNLFE